MSLINDALKKAARLRAQEQDALPPMPGGGRTTRGHGAARPQNLVLIVGGAVALVVVSAVVTGIFVTGKPEAKPAATPAPALARAPEAAPAAVMLPAIALASAPAVTSAPAVISVPVPAAPSPTPTPRPSPASVSVAPIAAAPAPPVPISSPTAAPTAPPAEAPVVVQSAADRIQAYIDGLHVTGVRAAGRDSKALVNGHVFKVNDILDRSLGLRLVKVDEDHLTFEDAAGATYIKAF